MTKAMSMAKVMKMDPKASQLLQIMMSRELANLGKKEYIKSVDYEQQLMQMFKEQGWKGVEHDDADQEAKEVGLTGDDKKLWDLLDEARATGFMFNKRTALGSRFERWMKKHWTQEAQKQHEQASSTFKQAKRQDWAKERFESIEKTRKMIEEHVESEQLIGKPMNLDQLIIDQGGFDRPSAVQGALNIAMTMIRKGPPFVSINPDSSRIEFCRRVKKTVLDKRKSYQNITTESNFKKARTGTSSGSADEGSAPAVAAPADGDGSVETPAARGMQAVEETPIKDTDKDKEKDKAARVKAKAKPKPAPGKHSKRGEKPKTPEGKALIKKIQETVNLYATSTRSVIKIASTDPNWATVKGFAPKIQKQLEKVENLNSDNSVFSAIMVHGVDYQDGFSSEERYAACTAIMAQLEKLRTMVNKLRQMHSLGAGDDDSD
ncbi:unnamed protein product [Prorocentrum cordatum]|uniref:Uncharacterized protein n=1 Tax=Prorocentrum cordatum TaxID=2364126 RepID=A0ABN9PPF8_9DINO|nr:unnamed protein product [Polarella glacialis]